MYLCALFRLTKIMKKAITLFTIALTVLSCARPVQKGRECIPLVNEIRADKSCREHILLSGYDARSHAGSITVFDEKTRVTKMTQRFLIADNFDNVTAKAVPDHLPDFAGETIHSIDDSANAPYGEYDTENAAMLLREITLCNAMIAIDSLCYEAIYDEVKACHRMPAKLVVMSSPYAAAYGKYDLDSLLKLTSCNLPVLYPSASVAAKVIADRKSNVGVLSSAGIAKDVYRKIFEDIPVAQGATLPKVSSFAFDSALGQKDPLKNFLESYRMSGSAEALDALIVDDFNIDAEALERSGLIMKAINNEENYNYLKLLAPDFKIYSILSVATEEGYKLMRNHNIFTHNISFPAAEYYRTVPAEDTSKKTLRATVRGKYDLFEYVQN